MRKGQGSQGVVCMVSEEPSCRQRPKPASHVPKGKGWQRAWRGTERSMTDDHNYTNRAYQDDEHEAADLPKSQEIAQKEDATTHRPS